ncbi:MAG: putative bifunctional diguanylate cyclase/phosphodiesterase [Methylocella sp.]
MSTRASVQSDATQPEGSGAPYEVGTGEKARLKVPCPWRSLEIDTLLWRWQAAASASHNLPLFEELALDSLGGLANNVALLQMDEARELKILMAGKVFESWIGRPAHKLRIAELSLDRARALQELHAQAIIESQPVQAVGHGVVNGMVCIYDLVALPLSSRWGQPQFLVYIQERERKVSLVETMFQATTEGLVALTVIRDAAGNPSDFQFAALNDGAARLMRETAADLRGHRLSEMSGGLPASGLLPRLISVFSGGGSARFELECPCDSGVRSHFSISASTMGELAFLTLTDVSSLKAREESFRLLFEDNPVPMWLFDPETLKFLAVNAAAVVHYGYDRESFLQLTLLDLVPQRDRNAVAHAIRTNPGAGGSPNHVWQHVKANGTEIDVLTYWRDTIFCDRPAQLVAIMDVTERRQVEARIAHMAHHDALTGLPNRVLFHDHLEHALLGVRRYNDTLAILYLDLDQFKNVNDGLGHPAGDKLLVAVAERLRACLRVSDMVARVGGDEFAVLQIGLAGPHEAGALAERIVTLLSEPYDIDGQQVLIGASVGIALAPADGETAEQLLGNADLALYRAKEDGRRTFRFFQPGMGASLRAHRTLELDLRKALGAGEFEVYYQPLVTLETGVICGFEALLRWHHPLRGMVAPAQFIPLAEETGLIVPIGEWVLRQACAEAAAWPDDLKVAVNLSAVQFKKSYLPQVVVATLASSGLPAARLELEITESIFLAESKTNLATLRRLRALGVAISMDDFGTGYSGLSYLRAFPLDKIKIDRSFISALGEGADCMAIIKAIANLGWSLNIPTLAEGIETEEQLSWVREAGCTEMQGYLFSRPIPASEIAKLLRLHPNLRQADAHLLTA